MFAYLPGLITGGSLIVAIGAQNAFLIRQGLAKQHVAIIVAICSLADALLILLGIGGLGKIIEAAPQLIEAIRWFGVVYLIWFAIGSMKSAKAAKGMQIDGAAKVTRNQIVRTTLALTFLNPHVYLDTVLFVGSVGNNFGADRWWFAAGAITASLTWFIGVGFATSAAAKFVARASFWRILDYSIAVVMFGLAFALAVYKFSS